MLRNHSERWSLTVSYVGNRGAIPQAHPCPRPGCGVIFFPRLRRNLSPEGGLSIGNSAPAAPTWDEFQAAVLPGLDLESQSAGIETQQHATADLIIRGGNCNVLGRRVHVAEAALEAVTLVY